MSSIEVQVEPDSLRLRNNEVTGRIHLRLDDEAFPEQDWDDFVVVILDWWCALLTNQKRTELGFMDGPFRAVLTSKTTAESAVELVGRRLDQVLTGLVSQPTLARSVVAACDRVLEACRRQGWTTADIERLDSNRSALAERLA